MILERTIVTRRRTFERNRPTDRPTNQHSLTGLSRKLALVVVLRLLALLLASPFSIEDKRQFITTIIRLFLFLGLSSSSLLADI